MPVETFAKPKQPKSGKTASPDAATVNSRKVRLRNTEGAILASAVNHFARRGFEGASVREIAAQAGVQHGMIRHIFKTKEELWRRAIAFLFERMERELPQALNDIPESETAARFRFFVRWYVDYCARHPEHARLMVQQSILEGPDLAWAADHYIRIRHNGHRPFIERLQQRGELPSIDPTSLFLMLTAACQMPFLLAPEIAAVTGRDMFAQKERDDHAEAVIAVFLRTPG